MLESISLLLLFGTIFYLGNGQWFAAEFMVEFHKGTKIAIRSALSRILVKNLRASVFSGCGCPDEWPMAATPLRIPDG
jgi:hypothetical protein